MKICIATDAWHPQINGVVTTLSKTIQTLKDWGHQILLISPDLFNTLPCPTYPEIRLSLVTGKSILRLLEQHNPDAVHIATEGPIGWATRSACKRTGMPFTTSYHTRFPEYVRMRMPVPLALSYRYVRRFHDSAERTMVAPTLEDELKQRGFRHLSSWSRGVDTRLFKPDAKSYLAGVRPIFLYMGRVAVEKNLPAFMELDLPGTKYVVGDGPALGEYREKYPDIQFTGAKKGEELSRHLAAADVFVFPSLTDTFGVALLEALACGTPAAAFPVIGPKYLIKNGVNGYTDTDLRRAALKALSISQTDCLRSIEPYSWDACTEQFFNNLAFREH